jgi:hypothetical protein
MFWKPGISYKMRSQNAANAISEVQILNIFWGDAPRPPSNTRAFGTRPPQNFAKFPPLIKKSLHKDAQSSPVVYRTTD